MSKRTLFETSGVKMLRAIFCLITVLLVLACKDPSSNISTRPETPENNQYVVYKAVISDSQIGIYYRTIAVEKYTKENHSGVSPDKEWLKKMLPELQDETLQDFKTKNVNPVMLSDSFDLKAEFVFIDKNQDWSKKFPQGKIAFSNVGFNEQMNQGANESGARLLRRY